MSMALLVVFLVIGFLNVSMRFGILAELSEICYGSLDFSIGHGVFLRQSM